MAIVNANPACHECRGTGQVEYEYCGQKHAVRCWDCFPIPHCPGCGALWYSPDNHHPGCPEVGTVAPATDRSLR